MNSQEFDDLIKKDKYQVFVFTSPCSFPVPFVRHSWFVLNKKGVISRWEVRHLKRIGENDWGYLHKDYFLPWQGIEIIVNFPRIFFWGSSLLGLVEDDEDSLVALMIEFINNSHATYKFKDVYHLFPGPNSNTYTQWVLDNFPELNIKLPWNCFGKNYK